MTADSYSRTYPIGDRRSVTFTSPRPLASGIVVGAAYWLPTKPRADELTAAEWREYAAAEADFNSLWAATYDVALAPPRAN